MHPGRNGFLAMTVAILLAAPAGPAAAEAEVDSLLGAPLRGADLDETATGAGALGGLSGAHPDQRQLMENTGRMPIGNPTGSNPSSDMNADIGLNPMIEFLTPNVTIRGGAF